MTADAALLPAESWPGRRRRVSALTEAAGAIVLLMLACVVAGPWIAPHDPSAQNPLLGPTGPGAGHWLGTDQLGRDVLSRVIIGARPALIGPICIAAATVVVGASLGLLAGYRGGVADALLNRFADLVYALPALLVTMVIVGVAGGGYWLAVTVLIILSLPGEIRLCRSATIVQARLPYVDAAQTLGITARRVMFGHILPNIMPTVVATFLLDFAGALVGFSSLAFLGFGVQPGSPAWGSMLAEGQSLIFVNPWLSLAPAIMLILTTASVTLLGDWVYDQFAAGPGTR
jgi:ABC-type dipeptide/oligopeptide/nickel transport system permease subunit